MRHTETQAETGRDTDIWLDVVGRSETQRHRQKERDTKTSGWMFCDSDRKGGVRHRDTGRNRERHGHLAGCCCDSDRKGRVRHRDTQAETRRDTDIWRDVLRQPQKSRSEAHRDTQTETRRDTDTWLDVVASQVRCCSMMSARLRVMLTYTRVTATESAERGRHRPIHTETRETGIAQWLE